jgi:hypothetical protein
MCQFVFNKDIWPKELEEGEVIDGWQCPYPPIGETPFCVFHHVPRDRELLVGDEEAVRRACREAISEIGQLAVLCTYLPELDLSGIDRLISGNAEIQIGFSEIADELYLPETVPTGITLNQCTIEHFNAQNTTFRSDLKIRNTQVSEFDASRGAFEEDMILSNDDFGHFKFKDTVVRGSAYFCDPLAEGETINQFGKKPSTFHSPVIFNGTHLQGSVVAAGCRFEEGIAFISAEIEGVGVFDGVSAERIFSLYDSTCDETLRFLDTELDLLDCRELETDSLHIEKGEIGALPFNVARRVANHAVAEGTATSHDWHLAERDQDEFLKVIADQIEDASIILNKSLIHDRLQIVDVETRRPCYASEADIRGELQIEIRSPNDPPLFLMHRANLERGEIKIDDTSPVFELSSATVGDVQFVGERDVNPFDYLFFDNTSFEHFDFPGHQEYLEEINWELDSVERETFWGTSSRRESTYTKARHGASTVGDKRAISQFFIKQHRIRRLRHREILTNSAREPAERIVAFYRYFANNLFDRVCKYGESSGRTILFSIVTIFGFSAIYWLLGVDVGFDALQLSVGDLDLVVPGSEYLIFSIQAFSTFLLAGGTSVSDSSIRLVASTESFIGAFAVGLFVATLIRSVDK